MRSTVSIYTLTAAGRGTDSNGQPASIALTTQRTVSKGELIEDYLSEIIIALRKTAENAGIKDLRVSEASSSRNVFSAGGIPATLQLVKE